MTCDQLVELVESR